MHTTHLVLEASATPVQTVTIHQSTAEINRRIQVELQGGINVVEIRGLSSQIDTDSLRLHVSDPSTLRVLENTCRLVPTAPFGPHGKHADVLRTLASKRSVLESERALRQKEVDVLDEAARALVGVQPGDLNAFMETFVERRRAAQKALLDLVGQINAIEHEASALSNASKGEGNAVATLTLYAERESSVELQLTYVVAGVAWNPYYDFHAQTADGKTSPDVVLLYCASVSQATGEDWSNATLVLTTAGAQNLRNLAIPTLESIKISSFPVAFGDRQPQHGLFGSISPSSTAPRAGGLFGQSSTAAPAGGLFGGGGLFGSSSATSSAAQPPTGATSAFGQTAAPTVNTVFGQGSSTTAQSAQGGTFQHPLFGAPQSQQQQPQSFSSFGATASNAPPVSAFGASSTSAAGTRAPFVASSNPSTGNAAPTFQDILSSLERYGSSGAPTNSGTGAFGTFPTNTAPVQSAFGQSSQPTSGVFGSPSTAAAQPSTGESSNTIQEDGGSVYFAPLSTVDRSPVAASYRLKDKVSIPSDGNVHKVTIARLEFNAQIEYISVPRKSAGVFVQAHVKNTSEYELLAGPVNVFMNNSLVAKATLPVVAPNDSFDCVLGVDTALKVTYQSAVRTVNDPTYTFAAQTKTVTRTLTTTVTNGHAFDITNLVIKDAIPLGSGISNLFVTLRKPAGLAHAKDGDEIPVPVENGAEAHVKTRWSKLENGQGGEKGGLYEWAVNLSAGKKVALVTEWDIKAPFGVQLNEILQYNGFGRH